jgi:hypothetical protein
MVPTRDEVEWPSMHDWHAKSDREVFIFCPLKMEALLFLRMAS